MSGSRRTVRHQVKAPVARTLIWLYYQLLYSKAHFDGQSTQNAQKNINLQVLKPFQLALPPMGEQRRIAEMLSAVDDKIDGLKAKQSHYQTLKRGLTQKLLTGEWRVKLDDTVAPPLRRLHDPKRTR
jgi:type I restriction enzyme, S subunit